jgi:NTP pyrophosphatase (non-canonical NTP hydrolase)
MDATTTIESLKDALRAFARARAWEPYHTPKNIVMALAAEVGELMEPFLWLTGDESREACADPARREAIADELADVACLVLQFSVNSGIDLSDAIENKMRKNAEKYPA